MLSQVGYVDARAASELLVDPGMPLPSSVDADLSVGGLRDTCASVKRLLVLKQAGVLLRRSLESFVSARPGLREEIIRVAMAV
eukprot:5140431-Amphidinium_carterae.1